MAPSRSSRLNRIATLAAAVFAVAGVAAPAAGAHAQALPDPVAHIATARAKGCAHANTPAAKATKSEMRKAVVCLINRQRTSRGLPALHVSSKLDNSAQGWTYTMVNDDSFTHGDDFAARISAAGYEWSEAGENIASGYSTPAKVVNAWMASPGHCRNILDPEYSSVGTGVDARPVRSAASGPATWTQDFALGLYQHAPSGNWAPADSCGAE